MKLVKAKELRKINRYDEDIELNILACLIYKPELMEQLILEDKHFLKHKRMWLFMKAFYKKFKTFDSTLMATVATDKRQVVDYTSLIIMCNPIIENFNLYQQRLIEMCEENEKDKWIIRKVYDLANDLLVRNITVQEFKEKFKKTCEDANKIFKEEEKC